MLDWLFEVERILHIHWKDFVSNDVVRSRTRDNRSCQILSVNGACPSLVICAVPISVKTTPELSGPAFGVLPRTGRPRQTWLRTVEDDLRPLNLGLSTARRRAMDRPAWRLLVDATTSSWHAPPERERNAASLLVVESDWQTDRVQHHLKYSDSLECV